MFNLDAFYNSFTIYHGSGGIGGKGRNNFRIDVRRVRPQTSNSFKYVYIYVFNVFLYINTFSSFLRVFSYITLSFLSFYLSFSLSLSLSLSLHLLFLHSLTTYRWGRRPWRGRKSSRPLPGLRTGAWSRWTRRGRLSRSRPCRRCGMPVQQKTPKYEGEKLFWELLRSQDVSEHFVFFCPLRKDLRLFTFFIGAK